MSRSTNIAIVGMACRVPGARNVDEFWANLCAGMESIRPLGEQEMLAAGLRPSALDDPFHVAAGALVSDVERFDAAFFGMPQREAELMDPQQRLFLEGAWTALEHAGYNPMGLDGAVGVFGGANFNSYLTRNLLPAGVLDDPSSVLAAVLSNDKDYLATRVAYKLNLNGPALTVQSACSTSLLAVHLAVQSLLAYECDMALAGGVAVDHSRAQGYWAHEGSVNSPDGHVRAFDARARGTVFGNGMGMVVLKRLDDAERDGDQIYAVILGSAVNNDGAQKVGFSAPGLAGQVAVITEALADAGVPPESIGYVEAHGTGTSLGDPVEVEALTRAFGSRPAAYARCALGAVKTNIGHLDCAAGVMGLIKTALALRSGLLPASLNFETPNPAIDFDRSPFFVNTALREWTGTHASVPRRAGVSSFGMGGTNVHVVMEAPAVAPPPTSSRDNVLLVWSARTPEALDDATSALREHLEQAPQVSLADVASTLQRGRQRFSHRRVLACHDLRDACEALASPDAGRVRTRVSDDDRSPVAFMFPGQGSQFSGMARDLYATEPVFRAELDGCAAELRADSGIDLLSVLYPESRAADGDDSLLDTAWAQPALFAVEYALARLWMERGIKPASFIGHSVGELVAACLAGVFSRRDALRVVAARGSLMQQQPRGAMTAVPRAADALMLDADLSLAAVNAPELCVVSGPVDRVERFEQGMLGEGVSCRRLHTSHAFHSAMMEPALEPFRQVLSSVRLHRPTVPFVSNLTGTWIDPEVAATPDYWVRHLRGTVRFSDGVSALTTGTPHVLLEVGPGRTLSTLARLHPSKPTAVNSLPAAHEGSDGLALLDALGQLWLAGVPVDWERSGASAVRRVPVPTYPFQRVRCWIDRPEDEDEPDNGPLRKLPNPADWLYVPSWRQSPAVTRLQAGTLADRNWIVLGGDSPVSTEVVSRLREVAGASIVVAAPRDSRLAASADCVVDPQAGQGYAGVAALVASRGWSAVTVLHMWALEADSEPAVTAETVRRAMALGFYSVVRLVQAFDAAGVEAAVSLKVVTAGAHDVLGSESLDVAAAAALSPVLVLPQERPSFDCAAIDITDRSADAADLLLAELTAAVPETVLALRGRARFTPEWQPLNAPTHATVADGDGVGAIRPGGTYVVLGGLGKIGLALAHHLATKTPVNLVLVGRTAPLRDEWDQMSASADPAVAERVRRLRELEALGSTVRTMRADVADAGELRRVFDDVERASGRVTGVIAAAGIVDRSAFQAAGSIPLDECDRQIRPKLDGLFALEQALATRDVDFCVIVSSLSSILGGLGYSAYAAANLLMDAFVRRHNRTAGQRWLVTNWDAWRWTESPARGGSSLAAFALTPSEAGVVFDNVALLGRSTDQVIISTSPLARRVREWVDALGRRVVVPEPEPAGSPRADGAAATPEPQLSGTQAAVVAVWKQVLGIQAVALNESFLDLGGTSLTAVQAIRHLQQALGVRLAVEEFIFQTAGQLAQLCDTKIAAASAAAPEAAAAGGTSASGGLFSSLRSALKRR